MPYVHGKNSVIWMWDAGGTCRNLSGDKNNVTLAWDRENSESTTFGKIALQRLTGLQDATISGAGVWNSDSDSGSEASSDDSTAARPGGGAAQQRGKARWDERGAAGSLQAEDGPGAGARL